MRQIVLDTETTGLEWSQGHRIIEIGCVEIEHRRLTGRHFHCYLNPDRDIDEGALAVHGITLESLREQPRFAEVVEELLAFVQDAELVIHNADFDIGFLNYELGLLGGERRRMEHCCRVVDTLHLARRLHPGQRNSLDALCKRYEIDNSHRDLHGALLDAQILASVYLAMTGGQVALLLDRGDAGAVAGDASQAPAHAHRQVAASMPRPPVRRASAAELAAHHERLEAVTAAAGECLWRQTRPEPA
ncbi:MAG: DNA polymerase III subunit epsilon [Pseudomonadota bacterium]|nr:DNA polymerase III subunit epsilon [Pseudomonadota bacterium]